MKAVALRRSGRFSRECLGVLSGLLLASGVAHAAPIQGPFASGGIRPTRAQAGALVGLDSGGAVLLGSSPSPSFGAWTFGARAGYQLTNGLAFQFRYDYLSPLPLAPGSSRTPLQIGSAGVRYSFPYLLPLPFVEALFGPSFFGGEAAASGALGLGFSIPLARHFFIDLSARDWLVPADDNLRQIFTFELGPTFTFASPPH